MSEQTTDLTLITKRTYFVVRTDNLNSVDLGKLEWFSQHIQPVDAHVIERNSPLFHPVSDMRNRLSEGRPMPDVEILSEFGAFRRKAEEESAKLIIERDYLKEKATELAGDIANKHSVDFGEYSSANCPIQNAIDFISGLESTELAIKAPKPWTFEDKEAAHLPERGAFVRTKTLFDGKKRLEVMAAIFDRKGRGVVCLSDGEALYNEWLCELLPDETPEEQSQRLMNERIARMVALFEEKACHQTYNMERGIEAVVKALTDELSGGKGVTWTAIVI